MAEDKPRTVPLEQFQGQEQEAYQRLDAVTRAIQEAGWEEEFPGSGCWVKLVKPEDVNEEQKKLLDLLQEKGDG